MINTELQRMIRANLAFEPTPEQELAIRQLVEFLLSDRRDELFLLQGYAGTGKTSLVGALVKTLQSLRRHVVLLAPTGRAAKVFSQYAGCPAFTIHKRIYRQKKFSNEQTDFQQGVNLYKHTLFLVDEASMIANEGVSGSGFGTGRLLDDLVEYVYAGEGCRLLLMGDTAQLPPVGEDRSPALSADVLESYGLKVMQAGLTTVVRQMHQSGILWNSTAIRREMSVLAGGFPRFRLTGFADVKRVSGEELIEALEQCYACSGADQTMVVTRSNKRAVLYNRGIRARILGFEEELGGGDLLMVAKNNYFWSGAAGTDEGDTGMPFIANGDVATVVRFRRERSLYGFRFADVQLRFPDYGDYEVEATVLLDTLQAEAPALTREQSDRLFYAVWEDYPEITRKNERMKKMKEDPYFNALQVKYAYAVTCHKAQGGQWENVFLDVGFMPEGEVTADFLRWLYTATTRATRTLYLVNWPEAWTEE
ncbi:MAG: AAA family ATPase [Paraprevotella sp.]|nr:AAA family ATPase [Paraprevotella sp.]